VSSDAARQSIYFIQTSTNQIEADVCTFYSPGATTTKAVISTTTVAANTWYHVALVRLGNSLTLYINGQAEHTVVLSEPVIRSIDKWAIGRNGSYNGVYFAGQIDEFRIIKGKAMWTANFTPPAAEYTYTATYADEPKTLEKYLQLTSVLQPLRGGYGGNGGYGGGTSGSYRGIGGTGGTGRQNLGGFGGGGGGGSSSTYKMGDGGSILYAEIGGGRGINVTGAGAGSIITSSIPGAGGPGDNNCKSGDCNGGGGGGGGNGNTGSQVTSGDYSGGFLLIVSGGSVTINSGTLSTNGGNGGNGGIGGGNGYSNGAGGGGGGGGGGGVIALYYASTFTNNGSIQANGGMGGSGGLRAGTTYESGAAGSSGGVGTIHIQQL
jgi:hypothetical protein